MGQYRIVRKLSAAAGVVEAWAGVSPDEGGRPVVAKRLVEPWARLNGTFFERYLPAASAARRAAQQAASHLLEVGVTPEGLWLVEELIDGESLRSLTVHAVMNQVRAAPNEMLAVLARTAGALALMHEATPVVVHGDLCASTVLVTPLGEVRLLDVGVARSLGGTATLGPARAEPYTLAPEQLGLKPLGPSGDVFHLGLVMHEVVLGKALFASADPAECLHLARQYEGLSTDAFPGVPHALASLMSRMLAKDPLDRPGARDVEAALRRFGRENQLSLEQADVAGLFGRVYPTRPPLAEALAQAPGRTIVLEPPGSAPPASPSPEAPAPRASTPATGGVALARIATRRISLNELKAVAPDAAPEAHSAAVPKDSQLCEHLVKRGVLKPEQAAQAAARAAVEQRPLSDALVALGLLDDESVVHALSELTHTTTMTASRLAELPAPREAVRRLPRHEAELLCAVPVALKGTAQMMVAMREPLDGPTVERLKALSGVPSIVGVRASERAIRKAIERFYAAATPAPLQGWLASANSMGGSDLEAALSAAAAPPAATLNETQARLFEALLVLQGDKGWQAQQLLSMACGLARRLGASPEAVLRVRFAAGALIVSNFVEGNRPWDTPSVGSTSSVLGSAWQDTFPLLSPWLEGEDATPAEPGALGICAAFTFASLAGTVRPRATDLARVLEAFRTRYRFPPAAHDALSRELALSPP